MTAPVRVGAVSYLNTRPLVFGFEQGVAADRIVLSYDVPSTLAARMAAGDLDVALLPVIELARIPNLVVVPGLAIGSRGPCRSVILASRRPLDEIASVALDPESRTSNALARVLLAEAGRDAIAYVEGPRDLEAALRVADAAVRIGDKALFEPVPDGVATHDLGAVWTRATGLPFVFAVWAARPTVVDRSLYRAFHASKRLGSQVLDLIGEDYTWNGRQWPEIAVPYLREAMRYRLGAQEVAGMRRFLRAAARLGIVEREPTIHLGFWQRSDACAVAPEADSLAATRKG